MPGGASDPTVERMSLTRRTSALLATAAVAAAVGIVSQTPATAATPPYRVLFDNTSAETAGNADWVISTSQPDPLAQNANPTSETSWTGAISAWGVALQKTGSYSLATLPTSGRITYGDSTNAQDLTKYDVFVLPEPNILFTAAEKTAIMRFVQNGGGLFMVSDHDVSDRNNDGADSVDVLNDLMSNNSVDSTDPFGFAIDYLNIANENPNVVGASATPQVVDGPFGAVRGSILRNGTTATLHPSANAAVRGELFRTGFSASGTTGAAVATSAFGTGRVAFWGDSSPIDDGTGSAGNTLYDGWNDPAGTNAAIALNTTQWLAGGTSTGGGGGGGGGTTSERVTNGGFESGTSYWSLGSGATVVTTRAATGTRSLQAGGAVSTTQSATQQVTIPTGGASQTLTVRTYVSTTETGTTVDDRLNIQANGTTLKTLSNASTTGSWVTSTIDLSAYAGQTITLKFQAVNDASAPTTFFVDDVSVLA